MKRWKGRVRTGMKREVTKPDEERGEVDVERVDEGIRKGRLAAL